jgi:hypothetical protein
MECIVATYELGYANAKIVVEDKHFSTCYQTAVHIDIDGIARELVKRNHGTAAKLQNLIEIHLGASEFDLDIEIDIPKQIHRDFLGRASFTNQFFQSICRSLGAS